ncbi:MAG TPA: HAMP domain-containing sensor histidine kinase [Kofleriaceae bacterium]|nr:HAMP domain-containing sensor histidine kinase [Kofleriaceae bacterium]
MGRLAAVYVLFAAILAAAAGLAFYGYSYSAEYSNRQRAVTIDVLNNLAEEKRLGIETLITETDRKVFDSVDLDDLIAWGERLRKERPPVQAVAVLDERGAIVLDGLQLVAGRDVAAYRAFLEKQVVPELDLRNTPANKRSSLFRNFGGRPYLFSWTKRYAGDRIYYVLIEDHYNYWVGEVFPQFFDVPSKQVYRVVDENGELVYGNQSFAGVPEDEIVEQRFRDTMSSWRLRAATRDRPAPAPLTRRIVDLVLIGMALAVIIAGFVFLVLAARRERRANELKSEFISNVSHELKTPLSIISMFGELLSMGRTSSPDQAREYAEIIRRESGRLSRLIDNVLDFAKLERGAEVFEFAQSDLGDVVARAAELTRHRLDRAGMTMTVDIEPDLPLIKLDANAMTLATLNLLDNAVKYAADGKQLEVALRLRGQRMELEVRDHGPGIELDEQEHIFDRFYRARAVRLKPIRGSGIGLALVKRIAEAHHGGVTVTSAPGRGACFLLWLPARDITARTTVGGGLNREAETEQTAGGTLT